jgi:hypothetical protein
MTTPWTPGSDAPNAGTAPAGSTPPPSAAPNDYPPPAGQAFPPPAGQAFPPPGGQGFPPPTGGSYPPPGAPGSYPPGMIPPPAAPTGNKKKRYLITAAALVVAAIVITFSIVHNQKTATTAANVGDCIKITSATVIDPKTEQAPCTDPNALFMVTETGGSDVKCDENEPSYVEGKDTDKPSSRVCLRYNLAVGDCLDEGATSSSVPKKVDCSAATSTTGKLVSIDLTSADESKCAADTSPLPLAKRNIVYCFGEAA